MLKPGIMISERYEIIELVGSGGMADVYKAKCHRLNRFVAIKVLKPEYSNDVNFVNKFRGEAQSVAGLSHPNVVSVYDVGDDNGLHYIVMELVEGITLKRFIEKKQRLELREAIGITIQIAQGMEAAHNNHIIHRDIKPQNIIISREGKVMVTDFGIAKATSSNTLTSNTMGSVHYLSPEQARGGYSDEKSDIYSLGVTLYEMLAGEVPFSAETNVSVALLHIQGEAKSLRDIDPIIPISIDKIVKKCMQKKPERRYLSVSELIIDLKKSLSEPDGDFVHMQDTSINDSPTINISEDLDKIKNAVHSPRMNYTEQVAEDDLHDEEDDEEDDGIDSVDGKVEKMFFIGSIAAIVVIGLIIIYMIGWFFGFWGKGNKSRNPGGELPGIGDEFGDITDIPSVSPSPGGEDQGETTFVVPKVVGFTTDDAINQLKVLAPELDIRTDVDYSDIFPEGQVIRQYPTENTEWDKKGQIQLIISLGSEPFDVPNVSKLTEDKADKKLKELDLEIVHEYPFDDTVPEGQVIKTIPAAGDKVKKGDKITLYISNGPAVKQVEVPSLLGLKESEAEKALKDLGLVKGRVTSDYSSTYEAGKVTYQSNTAGQKVAPGTKVDITISKGVEPAPVKYKYIGEVIININPFDYIDAEEAEIVLEMEQKGWVTEIFDGYAGRTDFPLKVTGVEGDSISDGTVRMYVDNILFKMPGESEAKEWRIKFKAVEE